MYNIQIYRKTEAILYLNSTSTREIIREIIVSIRRLYLVTNHNDFPQKMITKNQVTINEQLYFVMTIYNSEPDLRNVRFTSPRQFGADKP